MLIEKSVVQTFGSLKANHSHTGFTLAEVLITLGIIGIIAAMTLPSLIQKNNNKVVEARLKKFYSSINQAILMAENDYGDKKYWYEDVSGKSDFDDEGNVLEGSNKGEVWFNRYLAPHLNIIERETLSDGTFIVYFADGGALKSKHNTTRDWYFYSGKPKKCIKKYGINGGYGICVFPFNYFPGNTELFWKYHKNKGFEPWKYKWDGRIETLYDGHEYSCRSGNHFYCTALIQMNNWEIPDDYPLKVSY